MNKPQTEGRVNHVCTEEEHSSAINNEAQLLVYLKSCLIISMIELDQMSAANTSVNKMRLDIFVLFNI